MGTWAASGHVGRFYCNGGPVHTPVDAFQACAEDLGLVAARACARVNHSRSFSAAWSGVGP